MIPALCKLILRLSPLPLSLMLASTAYADCRINAAGLSITPATANAGTHTQSTAPSPVAVTLTITGTYNTDVTAGRCRVAIAMHRAALPATMARSWGGTTMQYVVNSAAGDEDNSILITGSAVPSTNRRIEIGFKSAGANLTNHAFSTTLTARLQLNSVLPKRAGTYSNALTMRVYDIDDFGMATMLRTQAFTVIGTVVAGCAVGDVSSTGVDGGKIPASTGVAETIGSTGKFYAEVMCNSMISILATSKNVASGHATTQRLESKDITPHTETTAISGTVPSLDNAPVPRASDLESNAAADANSTMPPGKFFVTISPQAVKPSDIEGGSADILTITLVPF